MKSKEKQPQARPQRAQAAQKLVSRSILWICVFGFGTSQNPPKSGPNRPSGPKGDQKGNGKKETGNGKREIGYEYFWKGRKTGNGKRETGNGNP